MVAGAGALRAAVLRCRGVAVGERGAVEQRRWAGQARDCWQQRREGGSGAGSTQAVGGLRGRSGGRSVSISGCLAEHT